MKWMDKIRAAQPENAVSFSFERLIWDNQFIRNQVELFCSLPSDARNEKILEPEKSERNIGIYKRFLSGDELDLVDKLYKDYLVREQENWFYQ
jgi:hypothetical protein